MLADKITQAMSAATKKYPISEPFPFTKLASTFRDKLNEFAIRNRFKRSFLTVTAYDESGSPIQATFDSAHLMTAFDLVGRKAYGRLCVNPEILSGNPFLLVSWSEPDESIEPIALVASVRMKGVSHAV